MIKQEGILFVGGPKAGEWCVVPSAQKYVLAHECPAVPSPTMPWHPEGHVFVTYSTMLYRRKRLGILTKHEVFVPAAWRDIGDDVLAELLANYRPKKEKGNAQEEEAPVERERGSVCICALACEPESVKGQTSDSMEDLALRWCAVHGLQEPRLGWRGGEEHSPVE